MSERPEHVLAELTYRCPLKCPYCYNPVGCSGRELTADEWRDVISQASELGAFHVSLTGGEPTLRKDLIELVRHARGLGLYVNLITAGTSLDRESLCRLKEAGLGAIQLSVQSPDEATCNMIAGADCFRKKMDVAGMITELEIPLTLNSVLQRHTIDQVDRMIGLAVEVGARVLELACLKLLGWCHLNRQWLIYPRWKVERAAEVVAREQARLKGELWILLVRPDCYMNALGPCGGGWGQKYLVVTPDGYALPCYGAREIRTLRFENVRDKSLGEIWHSDLFTLYRGTAWMGEPCRSCPRKEICLGGCRCQTYLLAGDGAAADPFCIMSPHYTEIAKRIFDEALKGGHEAEPIWRVHSRQKE